MIASTKQGGYFEYKPMYLSQLPIRVIDFGKADDKKCHEQMTQLVELQLSLHEKLAAARTPGERAQLENQIAAADRAIDELVYRLYGLSAADIHLIEQS